MIESGTVVSVSKDLSSNSYSVVLKFPEDENVEDEMKQLLQNEVVCKLEAPKKQDDELVRSESLTYAESKKANEWMKQHEKKVHSKEKRLSGAISTSKYYIKISYCSISSWIECVCSKCEEKYKDVEKEACKLAKASSSLKIEDYDVKEALKRRKALEREKDKLYKQAYFEVRGIDE